MPRPQILVPALFALTLAPANPAAAQAVLTVHNPSGSDWDLLADLSAKTQVRVLEFQPDKTALETQESRVETATRWQIKAGWSIRIESLPDASNQPTGLVLGLVSTDLAQTLNRFSLSQWRRLGLPLVVPAKGGTLLWPEGAEAVAAKLGTSEGARFTITAEAAPAFQPVFETPERPSQVGAGCDSKDSGHAIPPRPLHRAGFQGESKTQEPSSLGPQFPPLAARRLMFRTPGPVISAPGSGPGAGSGGPQMAGPAGFHLATRAPLAAPKRPFGAETLVITNRSGVARRISFPELAGPLLIHGPTLSNGHCLERTLLPQHKGLDLPKGCSITVFSAPNPGPFVLPFEVSGSRLEPGQPGHAFRWQRQAGAGAAAAPQVVFGQEVEASEFELAADGALILLRLAVPPAQQASVGPLSEGKNNR